jgi:microcystin-dependent protein
MAGYNVNFTDSTKTPIFVEDGTVNSGDTSLTFPGRNYSGYGQVIAEDFLHLLENFASTEAPLSPVQGQLWYDSNEPITQLKIFNGTTWVSASGLRRGTVQPDTASLGDLWVNTDTQQLFLYSGSGWILVGPEFSQGYQSGPRVETIYDVSNVPRIVIVNYIADVPIAVISSVEFTPKIAISGINVIYSGVTLNSNYNKYYGTAEKAEALIVNGATIPSSKFLRNDITNNTSYPININNSKGVAVGEESQFTMSIESGAAVLSHKTTGSNLDIKLSYNGVPTTVVRVDSDKKVGINKTDPTEELDVVGSIRNTGTITTLSATQSTNTATGALIVAGGVGIAKNLNVGGSVNIATELTVGSTILPGTDIVTNIGTAVSRFNNVYASQFIGNFSGILTGTLNGNTTGSAAQLSSPTLFDLVGDITSNEIAFNGRVEVPSVTILTASSVLESVGSTLTLTFAPQLVPPFPTGSQIRVEGILPVGYAGSWIVTNGTISSVQYKTTQAVVGDMTKAGRIYAVIDGNRQRFYTTLNTSFISSKPALSNISENDEFLVSRVESGATSLRKITKTNLWKSVPRIPIGSIIPYAGVTAPVGWLFCDGSEVEIANFADLFKVISFTYGATAELQGLNTFRLPDLRARHPMGLSNMDNGITVPEKIPNVNDSRDQIQTNGGASDRIQDPAIEVLGYSSGSENMRVREGLSALNNPVVNVETTNQLLNVMNPFLTLNYIIYTGQDV